ncbi:tRNA1(Val) (adenine(37)-N6)-methyltransferase [Halonatronum saccharophilum]|uniref:tRNA1(Val) (adenine(37)-N6)-methyltransferase n=1 Tax=Halonatronum saccharophilum TaxID=150060 RepID=UPI0004B0171B|nr:tRNA1(Val) (adenine(37)-N6)-methyltransferase [Halonatronum saccharophilum]
MKVKLKEGERLDDLQIDGLMLIQNPDYFCFSLDAVLLSDFVSPKSKSKVLDLGTGNGVLAHLIWAKYNLNKVCGIDIQGEVIDMAKRSAIYNGLQDKINFKELDLNFALKEFGSESFDYIISNPPYAKLGTAKVNPNKALAIARHEVKVTLEGIVKVSSQLVKYGGKVGYIYPTRRLSELIYLMEEYNLRPKRMRLIHPRANKEANLVLVEGAKGGGSGLKILSPIFVYGDNGEYTEDIKSIYYPEGR